MSSITKQIHRFFQPTPQEFHRSHQLQIAEQLQYPPEIIDLSLPAPLNPFGSGNDDIPTPPNRPVATPQEISYFQNRHAQTPNLTLSSEARDPRVSRGELLDYCAALSQGLHDGVNVRGLATEEMKRVLVVMTARLKRGQFREIGDYPALPRARVVTPARAESTLLPSSRRVVFERGFADGLRKMVEMEWVPVRGRVRADVLERFQCPLVEPEGEVSVERSRWEGGGKRKREEEVIVEMPWLPGALGDTMGTDALEWGEIWQHQKLLEAVEAKAKKAKNEAVESAPPSVSLRRRTARRLIGRMDGEKMEDAGNGGVEEKKDEEINPAGKRESAVLV